MRGYYKFCILILVTIILITTYEFPYRNYINPGNNPTWNFQAPYTITFIKEGGDKMRKSTILFVITCLMSICIFIGCGTLPKQTVEPEKVEKKVYPGAVGPVR